MRTTRILLALAGLAALGYGISLVVPFAIGSPASARSTVEFLVGGPVVHDGIVAPIVGATGLLIARKLPRHWRTPVRIGAAISGVLGLIAVPAIWRRYAGLHSPGLDDRNYPLGLLLALLVIWLVVVAAALMRRRTTEPPPTAVGRQNR